ncbi:hypothetical protein O9X90_14415 [Agrobacterium leguminum]|uniref:hypothetical protein n=1 Tax=Agrobacterium leguminum TaxID=2792015 RepID=UPI0022B81D6C|nr:hypothetical protein [Agrobacterium leguminum]MCZ7933509.1 hypothetical protein [Agrobacterium leguminum]
MKINRPLTADFDPNTRVLTLSGKNSLGKVSKVELEVEDEGVFISWLVAALHEKYKTPSGGGRALTADTIGFGLHADGNGGNVVSFTFRCGELQLSFVAGVQATAPETLAAIQGHLEQALKEMGHSQRVVKQ